MSPRELLNPHGPASSPRDRHQSGEKLGILKSSHEGCFGHGAWEPRIALETTLAACVCRVLFVSQGSSLGACLYL